MAGYRRMLWLAACLAALLAWPGSGAARDSHKKPAKSDKPSSHQRERAAKKSKAAPSRRRGSEKPHVRFNPPPDNEHDPLLPEFEQDAAELRQWLRQRDTERQMVGEAEEDNGTADEATASAETDSAPRPLDLSLAPRHGRHPGPQQIAGRRRHVLDPSRSIHLSLDPDSPLQLEDIEQLYDPSELPRPRKAKAKPAHKEKSKEKSKPSAKRDSDSADAKAAKKKPSQEKEKSSGKRRRR